jgi:hypothetical protein
MFFGLEGPLLSWRDGPEAREPCGLAAAQGANDAVYDLFHLFRGTVFVGMRGRFVEVSACHLPKG